MLLMLDSEVLFTVSRCSAACRFVVQKIRAAVSGEAQPEKSSTAG